MYGKLWTRKVQLNTFDIRSVTLGLEKDKEKEQAEN